MPETHEPYETKQVVDALREAADFIESGDGGVTRFTKLRQEVCAHGRRGRFVLNVTYLDRRDGGRRKPEAR